jgi:hypothetical protein
MVTEHTLLGVAPRAMRGTRATLALLVACCVAMVAAPAPALAGPAPVPFADNNNNGVFDAGIDSDITEDLQTGFVVTSQSLVLPDRMRAFATRNPLGLTLVAGKSVTLGGDLSANGVGAGITVSAETGSITILDQTRIRAAEYVHMSAGGEIVVGEKVHITAGARSGAVISMSADGNLLLKTGARLQANDAIDLTSNNGGLTVVGANFFGLAGSVSFSAATDITVTGSRIQASDLGAYAGGHLIDFHENRVSAPRAGGWAMLYAAGSTIDVRGTTWTNLSGNDILLLAPNIIR